ncbi:MAG: FGGY family carbohydrate kinase [Chitinophagaceae bacterium]
MSSHYILALDQGTTSSRSMLFDKQGNITSVAQKEFKQIFPQPGWVEHDANEIWSTQFGTMAEAVAQAGINMKQVCGYRYYQPTGNNCSVGQKNKSADLSCDSLAGQKNRSLLR